MARTSHYILVQGNRVVADCIVPTEGAPATNAICVLSPLTAKYPDAAIYVRLGTESQVEHLLFPEHNYDRD